MLVDDFIAKHNSLGSEPWLGYCEAIITENGHIFEAIPSHQEWMIRYAMKKLGVSRDELNIIIPKYASPVYYIVERFNLISLWYNFAIVPPEYYNNDDMINTLSKLITSDLVDKNILSHIKISHEYQITIDRGYIYGDDKNSY